MTRSPYLPTPVATLAFVAYVALAFPLAPRFPFTTVPMYAKIAGHHRGAVPHFLANGAPADPRAFVDFEGLDPDRLVLVGTPCTLGYEVERLRWQVRNHRWSGVGAPPSVPVELVYDVYESDADGVRHVGREVVARGRARAP